MIKLKNIRKNDLMIECDIVPEDSQNAGHILVDLKGERIVEYSLPQGYEWCKNHVYHAERKLLEIAKLNEKMLEEYIIKWY